MKSVCNIILKDLSVIGLATENVPAFLERHLQHDLRQLQASLGCGADDACMLLHCILRHMRTSAPGGRTFNLRNKGDRGRWEEQFCQQLIGPVIQVRTFASAFCHECYVISLSLTYF